MATLESSPLGTMANPDTVLEHHPQLYFSDGDVVLSAKVSSASTSDSPPRYQLFRVHRPILRHNSPVFANLFADAAPTDLYDGVPLVEMIGDTAEALGSLLMFIYNPSEFNVRRWDPDTPLTIGPTVCIANKYLVDGLRAYIVQKVREDWPLTLEDCDRREAEIETMRSAELTSGPHTSSNMPLAQCVPEPASEFGCPEILPAAFYQLALTDATYDWDRPDSYDAHQDLPARWSLLEAPDLLRVLRGRRELARHIASFGDNSYTYGDILIPPCMPWWEDAMYAAEIEAELDRRRRPRPTLDPKEYPCFALLSSIFSQAFQEVSPGIRDPLKALRDCILEYDKISNTSTAPAKRLCAECESGLESWVPWARRHLWEQLAEIFELPTFAA